MMRINRALISEVKRRLPKNVNPPVTLELLLSQKAVERLEHKVNKEPKMVNNLLNKKTLENFVQNNLTKPFSPLKKKLTMRQSIMTPKKRIINMSSINKKFNTPFQIQHIKIHLQRYLINKKINKKFPNIDINKNNKNVFRVFRNQSYSHFNINKNNLSSDGKYTYRTTFKYNTIDINENNKINNRSKNFINYFYNENDSKSINDHLNINCFSSRNKKNIKPNCYYNKLHLIKFNKKKRLFSP